MKISVGDALVTAVMGYAVVFVGLLLLMAVVVIMGKVMTSKKPAAAPVSTAAPQAAAAPAPVTPISSPPAPGSAGRVKLFDVPDREAAILMAIVADKMGKPLNELRFISIHEIKSK